MHSQDGFTEQLPSGMTLMVLPLGEAVAVNEDVRQYVSDLLPGALFFGTDGSRESLAWDLRQTNPPVYLVDLTSAGWDDALLQAPTLTALLEQFRAEGGFRWA